MVAKMDQIRPVDTHEERVRRLGEKARREGVTLFIDDKGRWFATSRRDPSRLHVITAWSCSCEGFCRVGECGHHSLLLLTIGFVPTDPDPTGAALAAPSPIRSTMPAFDAIEAVLCGPERADDAFYLETILRTESPACDELPTHEELLESYGLDCSAETFLAWCDWCNAQDMISDYAEMLAVAA